MEEQIYRMALGNRLYFNAGEDEHSGFKPIYKKDFEDPLLFFDYVQNNLSQESVDTFCKSINRRPSEFKLRLLMLTTQGWGSADYNSLGYYSFREQIALMAKEAGCEYAVNIKFIPSQPIKSSQLVLVATGLIPKEQKKSWIDVALSYFRK